MSPEDFEILKNYVLERAFDLGLVPNWTIVVSSEPCDTESLAQVAVGVQRNQAEIRFCAEFRSVSEDEQREGVIHELTHLGLRDAEQFVSEHVGPLLSTESKALCVSVFAQTFERSVDWVARRLAPSFPLIPWKKAGTKRKARRK